MFVEFERTTLFARPGASRPLLSAHVTYIYPRIRRASSGGSFVRASEPRHTRGTVMFSNMLHLLHERAVYRVPLLRVDA